MLLCTCVVVANHIHHGSHGGTARRGADYRQIARLCAAILGGRFFHVSAAAPSAWLILTKYMNQYISKNRIEFKSLFMKQIHLEGLLRLE